MTELETGKDFEGIEVDGTEQEDYGEEDGGFENDVDISGDEFLPRGRARGVFRLAQIRTSRKNIVECVVCLI